jgi:hypothetical protein
MCITLLCFLLRHSDLFWVYLFNAAYDYCRRNFYKTSLSGRFQSNGSTTWALLFLTNHSALFCGLAASAVNGWSRYSYSLNYSCGHCTVNWICSNWQTRNKHVSVSSLVTFFSFVFRNELTLSCFALFELSCFLTWILTLFPSLVVLLISIYRYIDIYISDVLGCMCTLLGFQKGLSPVHEWSVAEVKLSLCLNENQAIKKYPLLN